MAPSLCDKSSVLNLNQNDSRPANGTFSGRPDDTVEFNAITLDVDGKIVKIDFEKTPGKPYTRDKVLARTIVHEMGHALLGPQHCNNPYCIMYEKTLDWEQRLFGRCLEQDPCNSSTCFHSPGESRDIRRDGVIHNRSHPPHGP